MQQHTKTQTAGKLVQFLSGSRFFKADPARILQSLKAITGVVLIFSAFFAIALLFKALALKFGKFTLPTDSSIDIFQIWQADKLSFWCLVGYEFLKLTLIGTFFYLFRKFLNSIDPAKPFGSQIAASYISATAAIGMLYFAIDFAGRLHLNFLLEGSKSASIDLPSLLNWQLLFITYFVYVFAFLYRSGVEMNEELELVI